MALPHYDKEGKKKSLQAFTLTLLFTCLLQGVVTFGVSVWMTSYSIPPCTFLTYYLVEAYLSLAAGVVICILAVIGAFNSCRGNNQNVIRKFIISAMIVVTLQCASFVLAIKHKEEISHGTFKHTMTSAFQNPESTEKHKQCYNTLQKRHQCCGVLSYKDWDNTSIIKYPESCQCDSHLSQTPFCHLMNGTQDLFVYKQGCYQPIVDKLEQVTLVFSILPPVVTVIQAFHVICTLYALLKINGNSVVGANIE